MGSAVAQMHEAQSCEANGCAMKESGVTVTATVTVTVTAFLMMVCQVKLWDTDRQGEKISLYGHRKYVLSWVVLKKKVKKIE